MSHKRKRKSRRIKRRTNDPQVSQPVSKEGLEDPISSSPPADDRGVISRVAHLTPGEIVIPPSVIDGALASALQDAFAADGLDMGRYTVGGADDSVNPETGLREYFYFNVDDPAAGEGDLSKLDWEPAAADAEVATASSETPVPDLSFLTNDTNFGGEVTLPYADYSFDPEAGFITLPWNEEASRRGPLVDTEIGAETRRLTGDGLGAASGVPGPAVGTSEGYTPNGDYGFGYFPGAAPASVPGVDPDGYDNYRTDNLSSGTLVPGTLEAFAGGQGATNGVPSRVRAPMVPAPTQPAPRAAREPVPEPIDEDPNAPGNRRAWYRDSHRVIEATRNTEPLDPRQTFPPAQRAPHMTRADAEGITERIMQWQQTQVPRTFTPAEIEKVRQALANLKLKRQEAFGARKAFDAAVNSENADIEEIRNAYANYRAAQNDFEAVSGFLRNQPAEMRDALNGPPPTYDEVNDPENGWEKMTGLFVNFYHQNLLPWRWTEKFVHPDGREFVFDPKTKQLVPDKYKGTFNFAHPKEDPLGHWFYDMMPYYSGK